MVGGIHITLFTGIGSIATQAHQYVDSIPSSVSGAMVDFASGATLALANIVNEGISQPIPGKYQSVLIKMTAITALQRMTGIGVDYGYTLGDFSTNKGKATNLESTQMEALMNIVSLELRGLGRKTVIHKVNG